MGTSDSPIPIGVVGGTGYGAGELLRLLHLHPRFEVVSISSRSSAGHPVSSVHTHLAGITELEFDAELAYDKLRKADRSAVFVAVPHGQSVQVVDEIVARDPDGRMVIVDLSGDLRLKDPTLHERFYPGVPFSSGHRANFVYGLPEINGVEVRNATRISNPGCLATAAALALAPAVRSGFTGSVVIDAKTGTSGAGREPQTVMHHPSRFADFTAYKVLEHRHEPELLQALGDPNGERLQVMFVPHLIPVSRGIFVSCYLRASTADAATRIKEAYNDYYGTSTFVRMRHRPPRLVDVVGTNFCDVSVVTRGAEVCIMAALDNLGKGMAGQAIQNLNLAFVLPEDCGLKLCAIGPV